ncbi:MAG: hypothetical protein ABSG04_00340, partial [Verrucomicrobiota bacterium]
MAPAVTFSVVLVAPETALVPCLLTRYHWTVEGLPLAEAVKVTPAPAAAAWLTGEVVITGGSFTVNTATAVVAMPN